MGGDVVLMMKGWIGGWFLYDYSWWGYVVELCFLFSNFMWCGWFVCIIGWYWDIDDIGMRYDDEIFFKDYDGNEIIEKIIS